MKSLRTVTVGLVAAALTFGGVSVAAAAGTAQTRTGLVVSPSSAVAGQLVYQRAAVKPVNAGSAPTGTVTFLDGTAVLGSAPLKTGASGFQIAQFSHQFAAGNHSLTARYDGDATYAASTSLPTSEQISKAGSSTKVTDTRLVNPGKYNLVAVEKPVEPKGTPSGGVTPGGTVSFVVDGSAPQAAALNSGRAHLTVQLAAGSHTVKVTYPGDSNFTASSGTLTFTAA